VSSCRTKVSQCRRSMFISSSRASISSSINDSSSLANLSFSLSCLNIQLTSLFAQYKSAAIVFIIVRLTLLTIVYCAIDMIQLKRYIIIKSFINCERYVIFRIYSKFSSHSFIINFQFSYHLFLIHLSLISIHL